MNPYQAPKSGPTAVQPIHVPVWLDHAMSVIMCLEWTVVGLLIGSLLAKHGHNVLDYLPYLPR